jgi:ketosteroid isomerase-like protein
MRAAPLGYFPSMTTSGLELVRRYRELIGVGDIDQALQLLSQEFEFASPDGSTFDYVQTKELWSGPPPEYDQLTLETVLTGLHEVGEDRYLGESEQVFRWKGTGEISNVERRAMLYDLDGGKIRRMKFFVSPDEAWIEAGVERP